MQCLLPLRSRTATVVTERSPMDALVSALRFLSFLSLNPEPQSHKMMLDFIAAVEPETSGHSQTPAVHIVHAKVVTAPFHCSITDSEICQIAPCAPVVENGMHVKQQSRMCRKQIAKHQTPSYCCCVMPCS